MPKVWSSPMVDFLGNAGHTLPVVVANKFLHGRWMPVIGDADPSRWDELAVVLEFESQLLMGRERVLGAEEHAILAQSKGWISAQGDSLVERYFKEVRRRVLESVELVVLPNAPTSAPPVSDETNRLKNEVETLKKSLAAANTEVALQSRRADVMKESCARSMADFENYQRRVKRDQEADRAAALRKILSDLVTIYDNASLAVTNGARPEATKESIVTAVASGVASELTATLARYDAKPMGVKAGDPYNPTHHEAVSIVVEEGPENRQEVQTVVREGFMLGAAILRPASVFVRQITKAAPKVAEPTP